jgi:hypothetical protein
MSCGTLVSLNFQFRFVNSAAPNFATCSSNSNFRPPPDFFSGHKRRKSLGTKSGLYERFSHQEWAFLAFWEEWKPYKRHWWWPWSLRDGSRISQPWTSSAMRNFMTQALARCGSGRVAFLIPAQDEVIPQNTSLRSWSLLFSYILQSCEPSFPPLLGVYVWYFSNNSNYAQWLILTLWENKKKCIAQKTGLFFLRLSIIP